MRQPKQQKSKKNKGKKRKQWWEDHRPRSSKDCPRPSAPFPPDWSPVSEEEAKEAASSSRDVPARAAPTTPPWRRKKKAEEDVKEEDKSVSRHAETADLIAAVQRQFRIADGIEEVNVKLIPYRST